MSITLDETHARLKAAFGRHAQARHPAGVPRWERPNGMRTSHGYSEAIQLAKHDSKEGK